MMLTGLGAFIMLGVLIALLVTGHARIARDLLLLYLALVASIYLLFRLG